MRLCVWHWLRGKSLLITCLVKSHLSSLGRGLITIIITPAPPIRGNLNQFAIQTGNLAQLHSGGGIFGCFCAVKFPIYNTAFTRENTRLGGARTPPSKKKKNNPQFWMVLVVLIETMINLHHCICAPLLLVLLVCKMCTHTDENGISSNFSGTSRCQHQPPLNAANNKARSIVASAIKRRSLNKIENGCLSMQSCAKSSVCLQTRVNAASVALREKPIKDLPIRSEADQRRDRSLINNHACVQRTCRFGHSESSHLKRLCAVLYSLI